MVFDFLRGMLSGDRDEEYASKYADEKQSESSERRKDPEEVMNAIEQLLSDFGVDSKEVRNTYEYMLDLDLEGVRRSQNTLSRTTSSLQGGWRD